MENVLKKLDWLTSAIEDMGWVDAEDFIKGIRKAQEIIKEERDEQLKTVVPVMYTLYQVVTEKGGEEYLDDLTGAVGYMMEAFVGSEYFRNYVQQRIDEIEESAEHQNGVEIPLKA